MSEERKDIEGYQGIYQISNYGRVYSIRSQKHLRQSISKLGYATVLLSVNGARKYPLIHRLVAKAFIPNPNNKPTVNHKNEIKTDNYVGNLEWATMREQIMHGTRSKRAVIATDWKARELKYDRKKMSKKQMKVILQYTLEGEFVAEHIGIKETAKKLGLLWQNISACVHGRCKSCGGYQWKLKDTTVRET